MEEENPQNTENHPPENLLEEIRNSSVSSLNSAPKAPPPPQAEPIKNSEPLKVKTKEFPTEGLGSDRLGVFRFDVSKKKWKDTGVEKKGGFMSKWFGKKEEEVENVESLRLVTYNVWFGDYKDIRIPHLLEDVGAERPDFIGFQEITPSMVKMITETEWVKKDYYITDISGETCISYGCLLLSRFRPVSFELHKFPTGQGRKLIMGKFNVNGKPFSVGTVHLESYPHQGPERKAQLAISFRELGAGSESSVLMGDCNFPDGAENSRIPEDYVDAWRTRYAANTESALVSDGEKTRTEEEINAFGFTFDPKRNEMTEPYPSSRIDRIFLRSKDWEVEEIKMLGTERISSAGKVKSKVNNQDISVWNSDHFGLSCKLKLSKK